MNCAHSETGLHNKSRFRRRCKVLAGVVCALLAIGAVCACVVPRGLYRTLLSVDGSLTVVRRPPANDYHINKLPSYDPTSRDPFQIDLRGGDVSGRDLQMRLADLKQANFDDRTVWPVHLPDGFDPRQIMEFGRNPGLGVRGLHQRGVAGTGIGIGMIDQALLVDHVEYRDRLRLYEEIHCWNREAAMHGSAVASIAVGRSVGVAPEADLYYIGATCGTWRLGPSFKPDFHWAAKSIDRLLEINRSLPPNRKIRVISISNGWTSDQDGCQEADHAVKRAEQEDVFVITVPVKTTRSFKFHGLGRDPMKDPDDAQSYGPGSRWSRDFFNGGGRIAWGDGELALLMVPEDSRCVASPTGPEDYVFYPRGGPSWSVPYLAGLYALACQVKPTVTPEQFWSVGLETGRTMTIDTDEKKYDLGKIVDPVALLRALGG